MISEARNQLEAVNDRMEVIFILEENRDDLYDAFINYLGQTKIGINIPLERANTNIMKVYACEDSAQARVCIVFCMGASKIKVGVLVFVRAHYYQYIQRLLAPTPTGNSSIPSCTHNHNHSHTYIPSHSLRYS